MNEDLMRAAHKHSSHHRAELLSSELCGCFYCLKNFPPSAIDRWLNEGDGTAVCPECTIDSVLGDASGYPVADPEFLRSMHAFWFERTVRVGGAS